jgi:hypothetical protein
MEEKNKICLGDEVEDLITGYKGVAVAKHKITGEVIKEIEAESLREAVKCFNLAQDFMKRIKLSQKKIDIEMFDKIIVGSNYHKEKLGWPNVRTVYLPLPPFFGRASFTENNIVSVARPGIQKHNAKLERFVEKAFGLTIHKYNPTSWKDYYTFLGRARILLITSKEETFGYQVIDAILNQCTPIAPNAFSYPELLPKNYLYNNKEELFNLISQAFDNELKPPPLPNFLDFYEQLYYIMKNE